MMKKFKIVRDFREKGACFEQNVTLVNAETNTNLKRTTVYD